jgi:hypothetical protein
MFPYQCVSELSSSLYSSSPTDYKLELRIIAVSSRYIAMAKSARRLPPPTALPPLRHAAVGPHREYDSSISTLRVALQQRQLYSYLFRGRCLVMGVYIIIAATVAEGYDNVALKYSVVGTSFINRCLAGIRIIIFFCKWLQCI